MRTASLGFMFSLLIILPALAGCNLPAANAAPQTPDITQAYQTVQARLTLAATTTVMTTPTLQASATPPPSPTSPIVSLQPSATQRVQPTQAAKLCDQAAPGVPIDVTVPDDTRMPPGQTFTKTWRLVNTGTCTWTTDYSIAVFSGEPMGATTGVQLPSSVAPGQSMDISVDLTAPTTAATYQGNWKLRNASGQWFGIGPNGNSPFWVKIIVAGTPASVTVTAGPTLTSTPGTPYPGDDDPAPVASGNNTLIPGDEINLDTNQINGGGADVVFHRTSGQLEIAPIGGALFSIHGKGTPSYNDCSAAPLSNLPLTLENMSAGLYLCYVTDQGLYGYMRLLSYNEDAKALGFQILTWSQP